MSDPADPDAAQSEAPEPDPRDTGAAGAASGDADADADDGAAPPPQAVIAALGNGTVVPAADLRALAAPDEETTRAYLAAWGGLAVERRRELLAQFQRVAAEDATLDFDRQHLAALFDGDPAVRILAIRGLDEYDREEYLDVLIGLLRGDAEPAVRGVAAEALGRFVISMEFDLLTDAAADRLRDALRDTVEDVTQDDHVRARALEAVGAHSEEWVAELIVEMYESGSTPLRIATLRAMGRNASDSWLPVLIHHFDDDDADIRAAAAEAAGALLLEDAVAPLAMLARDRDAEVRAAAVRALGEIQGEAATAVLTDLARSNDPDLAAQAGAVLRDVQILSVDLSTSLDEPDLEPIDEAEEGDAPW